MNWGSLLWLWLLSLLALGCRAHGTVSINCLDARPTREIRVGEAPQRTLAVGVDRLYTDAAVSPERTAEMAALLARERSILETLVGVPPPPTGMLLTADDYPNLVIRGAPALPAVTPVGGGDGEAIDLFVHEWTHQILRQTLRHTDDARERFLEDGFCDYVAHVVHSRLRGAGTSGIASKRASTLRAKVQHLPPRVDLVAAASEFEIDPRDRAKMCANDPRWAYSIGLSLWLDDSSGATDLAAHAFAVLRSSPRASFEEVLARVGRGDLDVRSLDVASALVRLEGTVAPAVPK